MLSAINNISGALPSLSAAAKSDEECNEQPEKKRTTTVLAYNTHLFGGYGGPFTSKSNHQDDKRAEKICDALMKSNADIIVLSEVWDSDYAQLIISKLQQKYPNHFRPKVLRSLYSPGLLLLSKHNITDVSFKQYQGLLGPDFFTNKGFGTATLTINSVAMRLFFTHVQAERRLTMDKEVKDIRMKNIRQLNQAISDYRESNPDTPVLVVGDLNVAAEAGDKPTAEYKQMMKVFKSSKLKDAYRSLYPDAAKNRGYTYDRKSNTLIGKFSPQAIPQRIDYILFSGKVNLHRMTIDPDHYMYNGGEDNLSDHFPIWLEFSLSQ